MIDWLGVFQNFGYPALISGALLYIVIYKIERITTEIQANKNELVRLSSAIAEYRSDVADLVNRVERTTSTNRRNP